MQSAVKSEAVEDSVSKVNDEVAVGEDLAFQAKWWRFERSVWILFGLILLLDLSGLLGRGPLSKVERHTADGTVDVRYERIERTGTPSFMQVSFGSSAIHDGKIELFVSESIVKELGAQRVVPAPQTSVVGNGGLTYTFPASTQPASVEFSLQPSARGIYKFTVQVVGGEAMSETVVVVP